MARPAEKARSMLNKWVAMRESEQRSVPGAFRSKRRPHLASECQSLAEAQRFRNQIVREIAQGLEQIQNPALGEHKLRDLNDEINHKMREKYHWNKRVYELGGVDYNAIEKQRQIEQGVTSAYSGTKGYQYQYFGAAKDLPGVKEYLEKQQQQLAKARSVQKTDLHKRITPDYFGWRDEEDGVLLQIEAAHVENNMQNSDDKIKVDMQAVVDYLNVPTEQEISQILLEYKKKAILEQYGL